MILTISCLPKNWTMAAATGCRSVKFSAATALTINYCYYYYYYSIRRWLSSSDGRPADLVYAHRDDRAQYCPERGGSNRFLHAALRSLSRSSHDGLTDIIAAAANGRQRNSTSNVVPAYLLGVHARGVCACTVTRWVI